MFKEYSEKNHTELSALTIIQGGGTVKREESDRNLMYDKSNLSNYKMVRKNDFIVHLRSFEGGLEKSLLDGIISPAYHTFHSDVADSRFYYPYFRSHEFIKHKLVPHVYGIRDGRSIDIAGMKTIEIPYTSIEEQRKIGDYLESLDHLITLHQRKCDEVKSLKKYMLQKMFPQNEQKVPEIRFEGFTEAWEQRKVSEIAIEKLSNGIMNNQSDDETGVKHINVINMYDTDKIHSEKLTFSNYDEEAVKKCNVEFGDIFLTRSSLKPEGIAEANVLLDSGRFVYDDHLIRLKVNKEKYDPFFVKLNLSGNAFKRQFIVRAKTTAFTTIGQEDISECLGFFPKKEEQQQIGEYFMILDHLITLHQRKPISHPNHSTTHTKHKGEEKYVRIRVNDRGKIDRTANLRRFPVDIPRRFKDGGGSVGEFQIYSGAE